MARLEFSIFDECVLDTRGLWAGADKWLRLGSAEEGWYQGIPVLMFLSGTIICQANVLQSRRQTAIIVGPIRSKRSFKSQLQNSVIISGCYIFFQSLHSFLSRAHYKTTFGADTGLSDLVYAEVEVTKHLNSVRSALTERESKKGSQSIFLLTK